MKIMNDQDEMNEKVENVVAEPSTERFPSVPLENAFIAAQCLLLYQ